MAEVNTILDSRRRPGGELRILAFVVLIAALLRVAWIVAVPVIPVSDSYRYDLSAQKLAVGQGYSDESGPTAYWPVGPSFMFSLCYRLFGWEHEHRYLPIAVLNLLLGTASVALTMYLARRWFSFRAALVAGLLLALWPSQIQFTTVLASETPMIFFMLVALAVWSADRPGLIWRALIAGVFLAAASFMRPTAVLLPLVFGFARLVSHPRRIATVGAAAAMTVTMLALILPWSLRNQRVFGEFVLISTNGGANLWMGNNPNTTGFYQPLPEFSFANEADRDRQLRREALGYIRQAPWVFLKRAAIRAVRLHERETIGVHWNAEGLQDRFSQPVLRAFKWSGQLYWCAALALALFGVIRLALSWPLLRWITFAPILIWLYFTAVHAATVVQDRYHFAFIPCVALLAAVALLPRPLNPTLSYSPMPLHAGASGHAES